MVLLPIGAKDLAVNAQIDSSSLSKPKIGLELQQANPLASGGQVTSAVKCSWQIQPQRCLQDIFRDDDSLYEQISNGGYTGSFNKC